MDTTAPAPATDDQRLARIEALRAHLDTVDKARGLLQRELHREVWAAFPENHGERRRQGVLGDVTTRSGYSREHVAKIRDKDVEAAPEESWRDVLRTAL